MNNDPIVEETHQIRSRLAANLRASSLSVLRLTLLHFQASSLVEQTSVLRPWLMARSLIQPEGPRASITTRSTLCFLKRVLR